MVTITAVLMVRNEAKTIQRTLASVLPHVDNVVVVDTGSEDDTLAIVRRVREEGIRNPVSFIVHSEAWFDYALNRNLALGLACKVFGIDSDHWLFMIDGDSELDVIPPWNIQHNQVSIRGLLNESTESAHSIKVRLRDWDVTQIRFFRASEPWAYRFPVHELPEHAGGKQSGPALPGVQIRMLETDCADKPRQWAQHEVLIRRYLVDHPDDPRMSFYLAQTLECLGKVEDAAVEYWHRYENDKGSKDEQWEAGLRWAATAKTYPEIQNIAPGGDVLDTLQRLTHARPWRAEAWYELAHYWVEQEDWGKAWPYALLAAHLDRPTFDTFMLREDVYRYRAAFLCQIVGFRTGQAKEVLPWFNVDDLTSAEKLIWSQQKALAGLDGFEVSS